MSNYDLIKSFVMGATKGKGSNLYIKGSDLVNYTTVIATRRGEVVLLSNEFYSPTTGKNQAYVRNHATKLIECNDECLQGLLTDEFRMEQVLEAFQDIPGISHMIFS